MCRQSPPGIEECLTVLRHVLPVRHSPLLSFITAVRMAILPFYSTVILWASNLDCMFSNVQLVMRKQAQSKLSQ